VIIAEFKVSYYDVKFWMQPLATFTYEYGFAEGSSSSQLPKMVVIMFKMCANDSNFAKC
jgi:hypothetical protein